ncbi:MAG: glycosyl transferase family 2, partial [Acidobacterium ailaaui]|nr:glycosyl transferase family 2 [Pseudacidobacterium ailaaui]
VLYLDDNYGSAGGYKRGLQEAYSDPECEFIWLLDDDNKPLKNSLNVLKRCWHDLNIQNKEIKIALLSWRRNKEFDQILAIVENNPNKVLGKKNSFYGFHILDFGEKIYRTFKRSVYQTHLNIDLLLNYLVEKNIQSGELAVAPYGGLFVHKKCLDKIGFPNEDFFVYADDHEWSYRLTKAGGKILLCWKSQLEDLEMSWHIAENRLTTFDVLLKTATGYRVYYAIRNRIFFEINNLVFSKPLYLINMLAFKFFLWFFSLIYEKFERYKLVNLAIRDGLNGNLGKRKK